MLDINEKTRRLKSQRLRVGQRRQYGVEEKVGVLRFDCYHLMNV